MKTKDGVEYVLGMALYSLAEDHEVREFTNTILDAEGAVTGDSITAPSIIRQRRHIGWLSMTYANRANAVIDLIHAIDDEIDELQKSRHELAKQLGTVQGSTAT